MQLTVSTILVAPPAATSRSTGTMIWVGTVPVVLHIRTFGLIRPLARERWWHPRSWCSVTRTSFLKIYHSVAGVR